MMVGATLIGAGVATYSKGMSVLDEFKQGLSDYMSETNTKYVKDIIELAH